MISSSVMIEDAATPSQCTDHHRRTDHRLHHHHRTDRPPFAEVQHVAEVQQVAGAGRGVGKLRDRRCRRKLAVADERIFGHGSRLVHSAAFIGPYLKRTDVGLRVAGAARRGFQRSR